MKCRLRTEGVKITAGCEAQTSVAPTSRKNEVARAASRCAFGNHHGRSCPGACALTTRCYLLAGTSGQGQPVGDHASYTPCATLFASGSISTVGLCSAVTATGAELAASACVDRSHRVAKTAARPVAPIRLPMAPRDVCQGVRPECVLLLWASTHARGKNGLSTSAIGTSALHLAAAHSTSSFLASNRLHLSRSCRFELRIATPHTAQEPRTAHIKDMCQAKR